VLNLIVNACDAMAAKPKEERVLVVRTEFAGSGVKVSVVDRGTGIPPESLKEVFKPFYSTKRHGLGLGLSVCSSIVASHGGELAAANNPGGGATFTLVLHQNVHAKAVA
jgi:C4-dicarboxylate-specific signal transduction histidine kinase